MKPAKMTDHIQTRPQEEMIGVTEDNLSADRTKLIRCHCLDGTLRANWHEDRRFDDPVLRDQPAPTSPRKRIGLEYFERHPEPGTQTNSGKGSTKKAARLENLVEEKKYRTGVLEEDSLDQAARKPGTRRRAQ